MGGWVGLMEIKKAIVCCSKTRSDATNSCVPFPLSSKYLSSLSSLSLWSLSSSTAAAEALDERRAFFCLGSFGSPSLSFEGLGPRLRPGGFSPA